jgi:hypothetical protein
LTVYFIFINLFVFLFDDWAKRHLLFFFKFIFFSVFLIPFAFLCSVLIDIEVSSFHSFLLFIIFRVTLWVRISVVGTCDLRVYIAAWFW